MKKSEGTASLFYHFTTEDSHFKEYEGRSPIRIRWQIVTESNKKQARPKPCLFHFRVLLIERKHQVQLKQHQLLLQLKQDCIQIRLL